MQVGSVFLHYYRDGATRSGVYVAVSYMVERLKLEQEVDVFHSVKHTRVNRPQLVPSLVSGFYCIEEIEVPTCIKFCFCL